MLFVFATRNGHVLRCEIRIEVRVVRMGKLLQVLGKPQCPWPLNAVLLVVVRRHDDDFGRVLQLLGELADTHLDLRRLEDVVVHLGERRVAVGDPAQEDHELQQVGVCLLPERLLRFAEQIVQECGDGERHRVRVEIVVQRVVAVTGLEANLDVVVLPSCLFQNPVHLLAEVALHFEHQAADLVVGISRTPTKQLLGVGIHARRCLPGADGTHNHHARVEPSLWDCQPCGTRRTAGSRSRNASRPTRASAPADSLASHRPAEVWYACAGRGERPRSRTARARVKPRRTAW